MRKQAYFAALAMLLVLLLQACAPEAPEPEPEPEHEGYVELDRQQALEVVNRLDPWAQNLESWQDLAPALQRSLEYVRAKPEKKLALQGQELEVTWGRLEQSLELLLQLLPRLDQEPELLAEHFTWYQLQPRPLFTGYFQYELPASLQRSKEYNVPLYGPPEDLQTVDLGKFHPRWKGQTLVYRVREGEIEPYPDRESIETGSIQDQAQVLAWAKDPLDVFFLQIQGSGRLRLPDGRVRNIGYAAKNDREYVSLGRVLARDGHLAGRGMGMDSIQEYLTDNQDLLPDILYSNPNYVFFRFTDGGPYGAMGKELTPLVSLATDREVLALGSILAYAVDLPAGTERVGRLTGLGLAQDVGGAIQGHHLDLYCGAGNRAMRLASRLKSQGKVHILLSKTTKTEGQDRIQKGQGTQEDILRAELLHD
ncbi:MAG: murein transglycosylase A [Desulfohalobiaceae bacterium]